MSGSSPTRAWRPDAARATTTFRLRSPRAIRSGPRLHRRHRSPPSRYAELRRRYECANCNFITPIPGTGGRPAAEMAAAAARSVARLYCSSNCERGRCCIRQAVLPPPPPPRPRQCGTRCWESSGEAMEGTGARGGRPVTRTPCACMFVTVRARAVHHSHATGTTAHTHDQPTAP